ncbi:MAG: ABC transporter ATP-binding protein [Actinomycetia bacterium]|nr:ABC transporter ATP-binding protein [Actinomycetes bacterium]
MSEQQHSGSDHIAGGIVVENVSVVYGERAVVDRVSFAAAERRLGIIGPNGSGKSTLARVIGGLIDPTTGTVSAAGVDPHRDGRTARARIGFTFADPDAQILMPTVREDVEFSLRASDLTKDERRAAAEAILRRFGLAALAEAPAHRLSSGEKQLLALAASLVREPSLLICDEPTTLLDLRNAREMAAVLHTLTEQLVIVSHDLELVATCDRALRMEAGRIVDDGAPAQVIERYRAEMAVATAGGVDTAP